MSKKLIGIIASFALVLSLGFATTAAALTASDIAMLQAAGIISATQAASLTASIAPAPAMSSGYAFAKDLTVGAKGADVTALQTILVNGGYLMMPTGAAYGNFGSLTKAALIKYQLAKGITPAAGYFGSKTRGIVNGSVTTTTTTTTTNTTTSNVTGTDLSVSLAPTSPMGGAIVNNQAAADMTEFTFTNKSATPAVVTNISLQRTGVSGDSTLANVYLYSGALRLTDAATVSSGKITFNAASGLFTVPAGSSVVIAVKADIAGSSVAAAGQTIVVSLTGVTSNIPVSAVYPVGGASFTVASAGDIATLSLGTVTNPVATVSNGGPSNGINIQAGTLNQTIWSSALNISQRAVYLRSLALKVIGSIPTNSLQNIKLYVAGVQVATASGIDSMGMLTFDLTAAPYKMDSSRTLEVRADVVNGSTRQFSVTLQNTADLQVIDSNYNVGIAASGIPASTGNITISQGSITVTQDSSLSSGNIVTGASNVALARYTMKAYGEDMKVSYLNVQSTDQLDNVALYANGVQIGSTQTISATTSQIGLNGATTDKTYNIGSSLVIPAGSSVTVEIRGDIKYNGTNATTTNNFITVGLDVYSNAAQGSYSQTLINVPNVAIAGPQWTVTGAGLSVGKNTAIADSTAIPNSTHVKLGSYILQTTSAEAVRVTSLTVGLGGAAGAITNVSNLYVAPAGAVASTPINPQASNNFSVDFTIPANGSEIVDVYGDLGAVASSTAVATTTLALSAYGVNSNISISQLAVSGQTVSVSVGTLNIPTKNSTNQTSSQLVLGNSSSQLLNLNFVSVNGASTINEMYFTATGSIVSVTVDGMMSQFSGGVASVTGLNHAVNVGSNGSVDLPITVTYSTVGDNGVVSNATSSVALTGYKFTSGNQSVSTTTLTGGNIGSQNMYVVGTKPTITLSKDPAQGALINGNIILGDITVAADAAGKLALNFIPLVITGNNATVTAVTIVAANGTTLVQGSDVIASTTALDFAGATNGAYKVSAGQSVTFQITGNVTGFNTNAGGTVSLSLGNSSLFSWNDVAGSKTGSPVVTLPATHLYNYPVGTVSVSY